MPVSTGILLDVSFSMQRSYDNVDAEGGPWAASIFQVIGDVIENDLSNENKIFALAFGGSGKFPVFDILNSVKKSKAPFDEYVNNDNSTTTYNHIDDILGILKRNGAYYIRDWVSSELIASAVDRKDIVILHGILESDYHFRDHFIRNILPPACRNQFSSPEGFNPVGSVFSFIGATLQGIGTKLVSNFKQASEKDVKDVVEKAKSGFAIATELQIPNAQSVMSFQDALGIWQTCLSKDKLSIEKSKELYGLVKPFIYGGTPLLETLIISNHLFQFTEFAEGNKKLLFVMSDGEPTDCDTAGQTLSEIKNDLLGKNATVVCCFVSEKKETNPKRLYSEQDPEWCEGAKFLFNLSSNVPTDLLPRAILSKRKWEIDIANNETKLFIQVSHPDNVREACNLARNIVGSQEALSEVLASVSLDLYINQSRENPKAPDQKGETCYANASATVLHLAMKRIYREDEKDCPSFYDIRKRIIDLFGEKSRNTLVVLQKICPKYNLRCKMANLSEAMEAITEKRPVVATFALTNNEWGTFREFYKRNKGRNVLTKNEIVITKPRNRKELKGHAVVLTGFNSEFFYFMNSWGGGWGDMGFFRVKSPDVLDMKFIDVFWELDDLSDQQKAEYERYGSIIADNLMKSLKGLQKQTFTCPLSQCGKTSLVIEFTGTLNHARCPQCGEEFSSNEDGNILALNMYLTSLSR